jgi:hypothetical protein
MDSEQPSWLNFAAYLDYLSQLSQLNSCTWQLVSERSLISEVLDHQFTNPQKSGIPPGFESIVYEDL